jgi:sulfoxide reductase heme-binding subunit YedZ
VIQWYAIRGAGAMTLILFSLTMSMGLINRSRWASERWPRFVIDAVHRNIGLLAVVFLAIHIVMAVTDGFVALGLLAVFVPFIHSYSPLWVGLGSLACDLLLAITITSLLRARLGFRSWRAVHWFGYLAWPVAVAHGIGNGTDHFAVWMLAIDAVCVTMVLSALGVRLTSVPALATVENLETIPALERV